MVEAALRLENLSEKGGVFVMAGQHSTGGRTLHGLSLQLTEDQKRAIASFWQEHGSIGTAEIKVDVVNDKVSPASIQVGTAK